ncbi:MAG: efflux RND transporter periplasmic adaptor subunit [Acidobacteriaceae bacterium]|nr:efflux RND transporter periplasmic adaptor subunit [Acidobacteriaceae bacterium]
MSTSKAYACLIAGCVLLLACSAKPKTAEAGGEAEPATPVQVETAKKGTMHETVTVEAVLYPVRQANIVPKISAPVQQFLVQRGAHVKEGQLVAVLEDRDLVAAAQESQGLYQQAQAAYLMTTGATVEEDAKKAQTDVQTAQATVDAAKRVFDSRETLLREGAIAQKLVEDARVALVQAQSQLEVAEQHLRSLQTVSRVEQVKSAGAQVEAAKAHLANAEAQVSYAEVRSPISGIVADRPLNIGEMASSGSALFTIVDISEVVARANVPVRQAADIKVGHAATISGPGGEITGKVTVVSPAVDPNTTTVEIWVQAKNPGEKLKPGITAQITVEEKDIPDALIVPAAALLTSDEGGDKVMIAGSDSLAHEQPVKVGVREGDDVQILDGVKEGQQVITQGGLGLDDKAKIKVGGGDEKSDEKGSPAAGK